MFSSGGEGYDDALSLHDSAVFLHVIMLLFVAAIPPLRVLLSLEDGRLLKQFFKIRVF